MPDCFYQCVFDNLSLLVQAFILMLFNVFGECITIAYYFVCLILLCKSCFKEGWGVLELAKLHENSAVMKKKTNSYDSSWHPKSDMNAPHPHPLRISFIQSRAKNCLQDNPGLSPDLVCTKPIVIGPLILQARPW